MVVLWWMAHPHFLALVEPPKTITGRTYQFSLKKEVHIKWGNKYKRFFEITFYSLEEFIHDWETLASFKQCFNSFATLNDIFCNTLVVLNELAVKNYMTMTSKECMGE